MDATLANLLTSIMYDDGYDCELIDDYSGRGMFGDTCHAISGDFSATEVTSAVLKAVKSGWLYADMLSDVTSMGLRQDSMGLGTVIY